mgnify:CR=1 FL=1
MKGALRGGFGVTVLMDWGRVVGSMMGGRVRSIWGGGIWGGSGGVWARGMRGGMMYGGMVGHRSVGVWVVGHIGVVSNCECNWHQ